MELLRLGDLVPKPGILRTVNARRDRQLVVEIHTDQLALEVAVLCALGVLVQEVSGALAAEDIDFEFLAINNQHQYTPPVTSLAPRRFSSLSI